MVRLTLLCVLTASLYSQQKIDSGFLHHRIWATVPMIGAGTAADPRRPMFTPKPGNMSAARDGILAMQYELSDDGKTALVEFVAANRLAFNEILGSAVPGLKVFERGKHKQAEVEAEFRRYKKGFRFDTFTTARVQ